MGFEKLWIIFAVCMAACSFGFIKYIYFISIGYGFAVAAGAVAVAVLFFDSLDAIALIQMVLYICYGVRLSGFLLMREIKSAAYRKTLKAVTNADRSLPVKLIIWVSVALLYTMQVSAMFYRLYNGVHQAALPIAGIAISVAGLILEAQADYQKSAQKKENPNSVAMKGLYRFVRCPNYLGEVIFWTGVFIGSLSSVQGMQRLLPLLAYVMIVLIMCNSAQRLEKRQMKRYGNDRAYQRYANSTPILFPFVPLYHFNKQEEK
ncbi:MAG: DUF1295 domain-containing protein [Clostridia bacterium]|nr:DUF1295 domain-containing protein [Clostridia bacterium]